MQCRITEELVKSKEPEMSGNDTGHEEHVLELNSAGMTASRLNDNG